MPAYSKTTIKLGLIPAGPQATLIADLFTVLTTAGWVGVTYLTGYEFTITSPQNLTAKCRIWDQADSTFPNCIAIQFVSTADPQKVGYVHHLEAGHAPSFGGDPLAFTQYLVWANACQFFIGQPGATRNGFYPRSFSCGVPYAYGAVS